MRDEAARGRASFPSIYHPESERVILGCNFLVKINAISGARSSPLMTKGEKCSGRPLERQRCIGPVDRGNIHKVLDWRAKCAGADWYHPALPGLESNLTSLSISVSGSPHCELASHLISFRRDAGWFDPALTLERGAGLSRCRTEPSQGNAGYLVEEWDNAAAKRWR